MSGTTEKTKQLKQKIAELSKIDPNSYISKEEAQQKRSKYFKNDKHVLNTYQSQNQKSYNLTNSTKDTKFAIPKKLFAFDTNYYKTLHSDYNSITASVNKEANIEPSKLNRKHQITQKQGIIHSPIRNLSQMEVEKPSLISLVPVRNQQQRMEEQKKQKQPIEQKEVQNRDKVTVPPSEQTIDNSTSATQNKQKSLKQILTKIYLNDPTNKAINSITNTNPKDPLVFENPTFVSHVFTKNQTSPQTNLFTNKSETAQLNFLQTTSPTKVNFGSLFPKEQSNKIQTQRPVTLNTVSQHKPINPNPIPQLPQLQKKKQQTQSLFGKSNEGLFNLNPPKPVPLFSANNLFQNNKVQPTKPLSPTLPVNVTQQAESKPLNLVPPNPPKAAEVVTKAEEKPKLFDNSAVSQSTPSLFAKSTTTTNSLFSSNGPSALFANTSNLFNNNTIANKPLITPISSATNATKPQEKKIQVSVITEKSNEFLQAKPKTIEPPLNLFQNNKEIGFKPSNDLFASKSQPSLFGKSINLPTNFFQNSSTAQQTKKEQVPTVVQVIQPKVAQYQPTPKPAIQEKKPQKQQKKGKAIGPGGQTFQIPTFPSDKSKNPFQTSTSNLFTSLGNSTNTASQAPLSTQPLSSLFAQHGGTSLFSNASNQLFNSQSKQQKTLFNTDSALFSKQNKSVQVDDQENNDDDDDGPIQAEDDGNPELCVIKYDYIQTNIFFKEPANKFREGTKQTLDNTIISIEKFQNSQNRYLYVRMPNKCITFCGKFLKKITEVRVLNNNKKNIEIKKILLSGENVTNVQLVLVKIQFKDETAGQKFLKQVQIAIKEESSA